MNQFIFSFLVALGASAFLTPIFRKLGLSWGAYVDKRRIRDVHQGIIARLGGLAIFLPFLVLYWIYIPPTPQFLGISIAALVIIGVFIWDDIFGLKWRWKLFWQIVVALIVIFSGVGVSSLTGPFGSISLGNLKIHLFDVFGQSFHLILWRDLFTLFWLILIMNVMNFLDGLDGLAAGVSGIGFLILFAASFDQFYVGLMCVILLGSILGFLPYNFNPAKIFLGDVGAYFLGFMLGVLSILSEGKLAIMGLALGVPILDGIWVIFNRLIHRKSPFLPDRRHLHHRLLDLGFSQRQIVILVYLISASFGILGLLLKGQARFITFIVLFILISVLGDILAFIPWRRNNCNKS